MIEPSALRASTFNAFAALKADGSITVWGSGYYGGADAPTDNGYTKIYSTSRAIGFEGSKGICSWINLDIAIVSRGTCATIT
jgi:hypothetical protein